MAEIQDIKWMPEIKILTFWEQDKGAFVTWMDIYSCDYQREELRGRFSLKEIDEFKLFAQKHREIIDLAYRRLKSLDVHDKGRYDNEFDRLISESKDAFLSVLDEITYGDIKPAKR